jgi:hypothetical protein
MACWEGGSTGCDVRGLTGTCKQVRRKCLVGGSGGGGGRGSGSGDREAGASGRGNDIGAGGEWSGGESPRGEDKESVCELGREEGRGEEK